MARTKILYLRPADESFWERAEAEAKGRGMSFSAWLAQLVRVHVYRLGSKQEVPRTVEDLMAEAAALLEQARNQMSAEAEEEALS